MRIGMITAAVMALTVAQTTPTLAGQGNKFGCPPGLAKKSPACVPPGLAKKAYGVRIGDHLHDHDHVRIEHPGRYGLDDDYPYYRIGDRIARVDRETLEILELIDAIANVLD